MSYPVNKFVYLGTGDDGKKLEKELMDEAKRRGFVKNKKTQFSPFVLYCIKYTLKHDKKPS